MYYFFLGLSKYLNRIIMLKPTDRIDSWAYIFCHLFVRMADRHQDHLPQVPLQAQGRRLPLTL